MKGILAIFILVSLWCTGCEKELPASGKLVVEGYLFANRAFDSLKIGEVTPAGQPFELRPAVNAKANIVAGNKNYELEDLPGHAGIYHYPGNDFIIKPNSDYKLIVEYNGHTLTVQTSVPSNSSEPILSHDSIFATDTVTSSNINLTFTTLSWKQETLNSFIIRHYIEKVAVPINFTISHNYVPYYLQKPFKDNLISIQMYDFKFLGTYEIIVCQVNDDFVSLFNEPAEGGISFPAENGIKGGYGIFTGIYSDTVMLRVLRRQ